MTSITFTGDIAFSKYFKDHWNKDFLDSKILDFLKDSDHVVANVEAPLTNSAISSEREINHFNNPKSIEWFKKIYTDIWTVSNNHILDCGEQGMIDTMKIAEEKGIKTVGAGRNLKEASRYITIDSDGGIGIFAVTYKRGEFIRAGEDNAGCVLFDEPKKIKKIIEEIKSKNRWCVLIAHGGDEFSNMAMPYMRNLYKKFLDFGADIVVGHHPHVVQNYEKVGDKMIFYSLGNFVFDTDYQRKQKYSENGILLKLNFGKDTFSWDFLATKVNRENQTVEVSNVPAIFDDLGDKNYKMLWPLGAKKFMENFVVAKHFVLPKTLNYKWYQWFNFYRKKIGLKNTFILHFGRFLYIFSLWKKGDEKIRDYLLQK